VTDLRPVTKLVHEVGGLVVVDHSAAAPYRLIDIDELEADVVAVNALAWGGPPIGGLVFRDPSILDSLTSVSLNPYATGPARLEVGAHQFGLLAGVVPVGTWRASTNRRRTARTTFSVNAISVVVHSQVFDCADVAAFPACGDGDQPARGTHSGAELAVSDVPAERVVQQLADNGILAVSNVSSRVLDVLGVNDIGGAVTVGLAHYTTTAEVKIRLITRPRQPGGCQLGWRGPNQPRAEVSRTPRQTPAARARLAC
jgi:cysteine sulfinate desulfinase/cysteine desulfurase-like protein